MSQVDQLVAIVGGIVGAVTAVVATIVALLTYRQQKTQVMPAQDAEAVLTHAANQLAAAVQRQWHDEEDRRRINDPYALPIRWVNAPEHIVDHWSNVLLRGAGSASESLNLSGSLDDVNKIFDKVPSKRIVVLGKAGSGKTILAVRYALGALDHRASDEPVPVVLGIATWDPKELSLQEWMIRRLTEDYPGLGRSAPGGFSLASALVSSGRILPVFDGFDEIAAELRYSALTALNSTTFPLVLTSRPEEFQSVVDSVGVLSGAAAVSLIDLTIGDLTDYLPRTTRRIIQGRQSTTKWDPVLNSMKDNPDRPGSKLARTVLSTPLMVALARTAYSDANSADPRELLDSKRFDTAERLEEHLLDAFIPAVYKFPVSQVQANRKKRFPEKDAQRWLRYLSVDLDRLGSRDMEWWRLRDSVPLRERLLVAGLVGTVGAGVLLGVIWRFGAGLGLGFGIGIALVKAGRPPIRVMPRIRGRERELLGSVTGGVIGGITGAFTGKIALELSGSAKGLILGPLEHETRVSTSGSISIALIGFMTGFALATLSWFGIRRTTPNSPRATRRVPEWLLAPSATFSLCVVGGIIGSVALGFNGGLTLGVAFGLSGGFIIGLEAALDIKTAATPMSLLRTDRRNALASGALLGLTLGLAVLIATWSALGPVRALTLASGCCLMQGIAISVAFTAWGHWIIFVRGWLSLKGCLPFMLAEFLNDAHQRGVLRQTGPAYQFRHARLQNRLAAVSRN